MFFVKMRLSKRRIFSVNSHRTQRRALGCMRVLSFFLALFLHVLAGLAFLGVSFAPKIHVDLNSRVYDVVLVNLPREKKIPDPVK